MQNNKYHIIFITLRQISAAQGCLIVASPYIQYNYSNKCKNSCQCKRNITCEQ